jgi:glycosyltransferase involved in cell wall biosynthesis
MNGAAPSQIWIHALGAKVGGGLTYLRAVLPELAKQLDGKGVRAVVLLPSPWTGPELPGCIEFRTLPWAARGTAPRLFFDHVVLPLWLLGHPGAVLYCSGSYAPLVKPVRTIVLLRNAIYFDDAFLRRESRRRRLERWIERTLIAAGARGCEAIHYPSRSMRDLVEKKYPGFAARGMVNYYGISSLFRSGASQDRTRNPLGDDGRPVFLYVMTYTLQKNLGCVLQALAQARAAGVGVRVVVTSWLDWGSPTSFARDRELIERHDLIGAGYLVPVGPKFGPDLLQLYHDVDACLFPSVCESFGHPLVEALALRKPLVCADRPYAREICGEHALYIDPDRPEDLVRLWRDWPAVQKQLPPPAGPGLLERFSWPAHVTRLIESLLGRPLEVENPCAV